MVHPTLFVLLSGRITEVQLADIHDHFGIGQVCYMPDDLQELWDNMPADAPSVKSYLKPLRTWLKNQGQRHDYVVIEGDLGAAYTMARFCKRQKLVPIYSTSALPAKTHVMFREY